MINVENAAFWYQKDQMLFENLSFHLPPEKTLAILGPNGVGKTSLLRCLMRFLPLKEGTVAINGTDSAKLSHTDFWRMISYVPQAKSLVFGYSVLNMVLMGRCPYIKTGRQPKQEDVGAAMDVIRRTGLEALADRSCNALSGGQLQMVLIARAMVKQPQILIMDEPESGLDMKNQLKVLDIIQDLSQNQHLTIVINTHFPAHALRVADKVLMIGKDRYLFDNADKVITAPNIREYFGVDARIVQAESRGEAVPGIVPVRISQREHTDAPTVVTQKKEHTHEKKAV